VAILLATYFYLRQNFHEWPPPKVDVIPPIGRPFPKLMAGTIDVVLVAASCLLMYWTDLAARRKDRPKVLIGLGVMLLVALAAIGLRFWEFRQVLVRWNDNAYASTDWTMLGTHLTYLGAGAAEFLILGLWLLTHQFDENHAHDVTLAGGYWYWTAATWVILYVVIFWSPHFL
jgi:cytochrome c oxidase subunit I+III